MGVRQELALLQTIVVHVCWVIWGDHRGSLRSRDKHEDEVLAGEVEAASSRYVEERGGLRHHKFTPSRLEGGEAESACVGAHGGARHGDGVRREGDWCACQRKQRAGGVRMACRIGDHQGPSDERQDCVQRLLTMGVTVT